MMLLAASDVAARGLDIPDVSHVFNYDIPWAGDDYVHRIGRTGRAGKEGNSLSLVTPEDLKLIKDIEKVTGEQPIWIGEPPTDADFADSGKRRRRGRGGPERGRPERGRPERSSQGRGGERSGRSEGQRGEGRGRGRGESRVEAPGEIRSEVRAEATSEGSGVPRGDARRDRGEGRRDRGERPRREREPSRDNALEATEPASQDRQPRRGERQRRPVNDIPGFGDQPSTDRRQNQPREPRHEQSRGEQQSAPRGEQRSGSAQEGGQRRSQQQDRPPRDRPQQQARPQQERSQQARPQQERPPQQERRDEGRRQPSRQREADGGSGGIRRQRAGVPQAARPPVQGRGKRVGISEQAALPPVFLSATAVTAGRPGRRYAAGQNRHLHRIVRSTSVAGPMLRLRNRRNSNRFGVQKYATKLFVRLP